jgi:hypothetical protein
MLKVIEGHLVSRGFSSVRMPNERQEERSHCRPDYLAKPRCRRPICERHAKHLAGQKMPNSGCLAGWECDASFPAYV